MNVGDEVFHLQEGGGVYRISECPPDCALSPAHIHLDGLGPHVCYFPEHHLAPPEAGLRWALSCREWAP